MKRIRDIILGGLIVLSALWWGCNRLIQNATGFDRGMDRGYRSIRNGMTKDEVVRRMTTQPFQTTDVFALIQRIDKEYAKTNGVAFKDFLIWHNGIDWTYCIGFDEGGQVSVKGQGGT